MYDGHKIIKVHRNTKGFVQVLFLRSDCFEVPFIELPDLLKYLNYKLVFIVIKEENNYFKNLNTSFVW